MPTETAAGFMFFGATTAWVGLALAVFFPSRYGARILDRLPSGSGPWGRRFVGSFLLWFSVALVAVGLAAFVLGLVETVIGN